MRLAKGAGSLLAMAAAAVTAMAVGLGAAAPASAAVTSHKTTVQCLTQVGCVTPDLYSDPGWPELVLQATRARQNAPVIIAPGDSTEVRQDWTYVGIGSVGTYVALGRSGVLGLTGFDAANYGADGMYELEYSPAGVPSGFCAANIHDRLVLRWCRGSRWQTFIVAASVLGTWAATDGYYGLSVVRAHNAAHHEALTGSRWAGTEPRFVAPARNINQYWDANDA